jgi:hypothetical protein
LRAALQQYNKQAGLSLDFPACFVLVVLSRMALMRLLVLDRWGLISRKFCLTNKNELVLC